MPQSYTLELKKKTKRFLHHKSFADDECVDFISLRFANVVFFT